MILLVLTVLISYYLKFTLSTRHIITLAGNVNIILLMSLQVK